MEEPPPITETQPQAPKPPTMSVAARLLNVFAIPGEVFEEVRATAASTANWLVPALLLIAISWIGATLVLSQDSIRQQLNELTDKSIEQQVSKNRMSEAQADKAREIGQITTKVGMIAGPVFIALATPFWWGLILWLAGAKVMKAGFPYGKAVETAGLANMIAVLDALVRTLLILVTGNLFAAPSLAMLLKNYDPQNTLHSLLALGNLMMFWLLAIRAIGLARLARVSFARAAAWVFGIWAAYTSLVLALGLGIKKAFGG